jgi:hypothetical protein
MVPTTKPETFPAPPAHPPPRPAVSRRSDPDNLSLVSIFRDRYRYLDASTTSAPPLPSIAQPTSGALEGRRQFLLPSGGRTTTPHESANFESERRRRLQAQRAALLSVLDKVNQIMAEDDEADADDNKVPKQ